MLWSRHELWSLLRESVAEWIRDSASRKGAALAYYTIFSLAPILILAIAIAGLFFGEEAARGQIVDQVSGLIGREGARAVQAMIENAARPEAGIMAALVGFGTLLIGATSALAELKDDLDEIWHAPPEKRRGFWYFVRKRVMSVGLILALGFLLLVSLVLSAVLTALYTLWGPRDATGLLLWLLQALNFIASFVLVTALFAMIYKILPAVRIAWQDVIIGAAVTSLLFSIGKFLIGLYLGNSAITSAYGAAGSIILVLVWVYYSAQIFLLGAEFTRVYAHRYGSMCPDPLRRRNLDGSRKSRLAR
jgi:membrane protein